MHNKKTNRQTDRQTQVCMHVRADTGEELRHFLALMRAWPGAALPTPRLPAPLQLSVATQQPLAGSLSLPRVGCGGCAVCR